jgi:hypothetical protein
MKQTILLTLLLACGTARASEWVSLGKPDGKIEVFVDVSSIQVTDIVRRAWIKYVPEHHTARGVLRAAHTWLDYQLLHVRYDCSEQTSSTDAATEYYEDGTHHAASGAAPWTPVPPDTVLSVEMQFICAWKPK